MVASIDPGEKGIQELTRLATTYALAHGLLYLPVNGVQPPAPTSAIHAPLALFPTSFPRSKFLLAQKLQPLYNVLYARVATDERFLDKIMGSVDGVGKVDRFTGQLWGCWKQLRDEGIQQGWHLGLFRSDYLLHNPDCGKEVSLKQVEFNTISSSFGTLSYHAAALHRYLAKSTSYFGAFPGFNLGDLPQNNAPAGLARGLAEAHAAYGSVNAQILFVVQPNERNVFDQRYLEYELLERHSLHVIRQTFNELAESVEVDPSSRVMRIKHPVTNQAIEISVVYFRAGYTPTDYPTQTQFTTRLLLERSRAIKCPTIQLQLAGGKKVQQVLTKPGVLESFLLDRTRWDGPDFTEADVALLRDSWMGMWGLDEDGDGGVEKARSLAEKLVLKPQREGGGNNVYKSSIPRFLDTLPLAEREAWIAMELIETPKGIDNHLVRAGSGSQGAVKAETISELGIFGWALFGPGAKEIKHEEAGWLVRTKGTDSDEGGIATGFSVLDSLLLVDE
ncbi:glutathione synthase [Thelephora ganbajun]|uniref:Glutathione synthase n=1 Tax=Thelephora ganbajun TaxID=370292 RepID=A0ACB6ZJP6_THEGA|nr:glutathione synthase [Thelephora ganbajun]